MRHDCMLARCRQLKNEIAYARACSRRLRFDNRRCMDWLEPILDLLALPRYGLATLFVACFISATLVPVASEPALFGLLRLNPDLFWSAIVVATIGNTLGGVVDWWMGWQAHHIVDRYAKSKWHAKA